MVQITVELDTSQIGKLGSMPREATPRALSYAAQDMTRFLQMNSPVDHGLLKSWFLDSLSSDEAVIKSPAEYAQWVNDGTQPYTITPTSKKALYWEGADHPVRVVHHPGIKARHFVEDSLADVNGRLDGYFLKAISEVMG